MSVNDYVQDVEAAARHAAITADAIYGCPFHSDVTIARGNDEKDRRAYAIGATLVNRNEVDCTHKEMQDAIHTELQLAADGSCPACDVLRDS